MSLTARELWAAIHGMVLGGGFLIAFSAGFFGLYSLRTGWLSAEGLQERVRRMKWWTTLMAVVSSLTVFTGTYIVYPWYRATPPEGTTDLTAFPRSTLLADPNLAAWHNFGMEWKEHVAWLSPILAIAVAYIVIKYGPELAQNQQLRRIAIVLFVLAFVSAAVAGLMGAFITKAAPIL